MILRKGRVASWFPVALVVAGSFALLVGIFVAVLSIPEVVAARHPGTNTPLQSAFYVGTNTCFTCHGDRPSDWSLTLYAQKVVSPSEKPVAVTNLEPGEHVQQIDTNEMVEAYTTTDEIQSKGNSFNQYYVIKTEDGHLLLPDQQTTDDMQAQDSLAICSTCHVTNTNVKPLGFEAISLEVVVKREPVQTVSMVTNHKYPVLGVSAVHKSGTSSDLF